MIKRYSNQNHAVHRSLPVLDKIASVYDRQAVPNRARESKSLSFPGLPPHESEWILNGMQKDAAELERDGLNKEAAPLTASPFEHFRTAKNYIASKLGIADESAHDLASGVVGKAQHLQQEYGGDIGEVIGGIVDQMDPTQISERIGAVPMRKASPSELEEHIKIRLMEEMQLSSFQADQIKKAVMTQTRNLETRMRLYKPEQIANAVVDVVVNRQDPSIVYSVSSSDWLVQEVKNQLSMA